MNQKRGAVEFEAEGQPYTLRFTTNAMARYQERAGETITQGLRAVEEGTKSDDLDTIRLRRLFWAGLASDMSEEDAGDIMDALGIQSAVAKLGEAVRAAFPQEAASGNGKPTKKASATP